ncbi:hypothetical protein COLO4_14059 [Corchorus olitorius]|uniref:Uncharacterized protein n=1 Tax=Corchorus olitorius TaxID=93759 RepID=A0A1R3JU70_9ROSI|nr:hypothetical protein COLO4_14059 [Corchorus olitorius]
MRVATVVFGVVRISVKRGELANHPPDKSKLALILRENEPGHSSPFQILFPKT